LSCAERNGISNRGANERAHRPTPGRIPPNRPAVEVRKYRGLRLVGTDLDRDAPNQMVYVIEKPNNIAPVQGGQLKWLYGALAGRRIRQWTCNPCN
jgi:hypothetical protein